MPETKVNASDVRAYFKTADLDLAELLFEIAGDTIKERKALSKKISENMGKARAARGKKGPKASTANEAVAEAPATEADGTSPIATARARRASAGAAGAGLGIPSVPAPGHTAEATSAESDVTI